MDIVNWQELDLRDCDLVLCSGNGKLSKAIQKFQKYTGAPKKSRHISHVAGIKRFGPADRYAGLQESTTKNKWCGRKGVQINFFREWLEHYSGKVYIKQLNMCRDLTFKDFDNDFWDEHKNDKYENGIPGALELLLCGLRLHRFVRTVFGDYNPTFTKNPHCTELQAQRLDTHHLWNTLIFPNRMPPWIWWDHIDEWLTVSTKPIVRVK